MENIDELRQELGCVFAGLKDGSLTPAVATEMNNAAGKMMTSVKLEHEYAHLRKEEPNIPFMEYDGK